MLTDGTDELVQLAELLRLGVKTARQIALLRPQDGDDIERLCLRAETIASDLADLIERGGGPSRAN